MPEYMIRAPFIGVVSMTIEAESEEAAKQAALQCDFRTTLEGDHGIECEELNIMERVSQGNILYAPQNEIEVEEV